MLFLFLNSILTTILNNLNEIETQIIVIYKLNEHERLLNDIFFIFKRNKNPETANKVFKQLETLNFSYINNENYKNIFKKLFKNRILSNKFINTYFFDPVFFAEQLQLFRINENFLAEIYNVLKEILMIYSFKYDHENIIIRKIEYILYILDLYRADQLHIIKKIVNDKIDNFHPYKLSIKICKTGSCQLFYINDESETQKNFKKNVKKTTQSINKISTKEDTNLQIKIHRTEGFNSKKVCIGSNNEKIFCANIHLNTILKKKKADLLLFLKLNLLDEDNDEVFSCMNLSCC